MYDALIYLVSKSELPTVDEYGDSVYTDVLKGCLAEVKSVGMKEFYQAQTQGMKPEIVFELADFYDYDGQEEIIYCGMKYKVLRTYRKGTPLEIVCYGGVRYERSEVGN